VQWRGSFCLFRNPFNPQSLISHLTNSNGCGIFRQGYADSVPVSSLLSTATPCVFAAIARSPAEFLCSWRKFLPLNDLPPLRFSLLSFSYSRPLFSSACSLFFQNAGGWVSQSGLWALGGSRRRLPVPEMLVRDAGGVGYLCALCASALSFSSASVVPVREPSYPHLASIPAPSIYF
jgi:hypothetical protein